MRNPTRLVTGVCFWAVACGGGSAGTPSAPAPRNAIVQATVDEAIATFKSVNAGRFRFELATRVTFRETGGTAATITQVTGVIVVSPSGEQRTGTLNVAIALAANGTASDGYTQEFEVDGDATGATWRFSAIGTDSNGRQVTVSAIERPITFPAAVAPAPRPTQDRVRVFGGNNYDVYLGCFSCNEFDPESIWNPFGTYGSPLSPTSINNPLSMYGSALSPLSACNQLASRPPVVVDSRTFYGELTLNQIRPHAIRDATVLQLLRTLCAF